MAFVLADRVFELAVVTGTGPVTLSGVAVSGYQPFNAVMSNNDTSTVAYYDPLAGAWEVGISTWTTGNVLTRTSTKSSSNGGSIVSFAGNTCQIFQDIAAFEAILLNNAPGGTASQVVFNNSGQFGGFTLGGDGTLVTSTGSLTLATVNANVGTFQGITFNAKGLATGATNQGYITTSAIPAGVTTDLLGATGTAGLAGLVTMGTGISLSGGVLSATGSGGTVTSITAGTGLSGGVITGVGTIANTGLLALNQGTINSTGTVVVGSGLTLSALGTLTAGTSGGGTVTSIVAGAGLTGGTITSAGTVALANATTSTLGGVIVGSGLAVSAGTISSNQTITLTGDSTGSGTTSIAVTASKFGGVAFGSMAGQASSSVSITGGTITGMPSPTNPSDVAIKSYVDAIAAGLQVKSTATVATTAALPTNIYTNGASGVGATIAVVATGALTVDGHVTALNDLVLVKNEVTSANNGLYLVTTAGAIGVAAVLTRATDMNTASEFSGAFVPVSNVGTANANSLWLANPTTPVTVGTTAIPFTQLNGATDLTQGAGISISGNTISNTGVLALSQGTVAATGTIAVDASLSLSAGGTLSNASGSVATGVANQVGVYVGSSNTISGAVDLTLITTGGVSTLEIGDSATNKGKLLLQDGSLSGFSASIAVGTLTSTLVLQLPTGTATTAGVMTYTGVGAASVLTYSNGPLGAALGGTGLASGTSGGILAFTGATTIASSALLTQHGVVVGGGGGAVPLTIAVGTTGQVLVSNGSTADPSMQSLTKSAGIMVDIATGMLPGTYDLGPFVQGGTVLNSYAHVVSGGTTTFTAAIGAPGTYTAVTGLTALAISTAAENIGTATAANVLTANQHLWVEISNTGSPLGSSVFLTVKVP